MPAHLAPAPMRSAAEFVAALRDCPSAYTPATDGVGYRHQYFDGEHHPEVDWSNPNQDDHVAQLQVVAGYMTLLRGSEPKPA